mgnify:CR=1 FL=1
MGGHSKSRDIPHVIKGLGTLADVRGHHIQALILPYLPAHLGEYMIKLSSAENKLWGTNSVPMFDFLSCC